MAPVTHIDFLIIGGGVAGTTAAETIRQGTDRRIAIITDDRHPLYSRVRLPDYVASRIPREKVFIKNKAWYPDNGIDLLTEARVSSLEPTERRVRLIDGRILRYERLLLAPGGSARKLECEGSGLAGTHLFRSIEDADRIRQAMSEAKRAVMIGGGFIGLELARCFVQAGLETTMLLREPQFWPGTLDAESGEMIARLLRKKGVTIRYSETVNRLSGRGCVETVWSSEGGRYDGDLVGVGVGIDISHPFITASGLKIQAGVLTDAFLQTSNPAIYAAGDAARFYDARLGRHHQMGCWNNAAEQGKVAGLNMLGEKIVYQCPGTYVIRLFGVSIAFAGDVTSPPGTEVIRRGSPEEGYARILVRDGIVRGATLINRPHELRPVLALIREGARVNGNRSALADVNCDLEERR